VTEFLESDGIPKDVPSLPLINGTDGVLGLKHKSLKPESCMIHLIDMKRNSGFNAAVSMHDASSNVISVISIPKKN
jgi:hypothetical protein